MFTPEDFDILKQPGSWEKVQAVQTAFFPKLLALQIEANKLIHQIYGIDINQNYKISQMPTMPSRKGQTYNSKRRMEDNDVWVGLRGKGIPKNLRRPDGKPCEMHFALLSFSVRLFSDGMGLHVNFSPYILKYEEIYRLLLALSVVRHQIDELVLMHGDWFYTPEKLPLFDTLERPDAILLVNFVEPINATDKDLAKLVLAYVTCFPMLDLFTRLSNDEQVLIENGDHYDALNEPNYAALFREWHAKHAADYIKNFHVEPITETDIWQSEARTRAIFEDLFGRTFPKVRPAWLKSGKNSSLELDGYCEELKLAFEYQGEYHYMEIPVHHQQRTLKEVLQNDELKAKICRKQGVSLIQVPYWEKGNIGWIVEAVNALNRPELRLISPMA